MVVLAPPISDMERPDYWRALAPDLQVTDLPWASEQTTPAVLAQASEYRTTGIAAFEAVLPKDVILPLAAVLDVLVARGIPTPFLFIFDETWQIYQRLDGLIANLMGNDYLLGGDLWAWKLDRMSSGWSPHVDAMFKVPDLRPSGDPNYASLWISLTDTDESNGCIRAVPRGAEDPPARPSTPDLPSLATALAVPEGSLLSWAPDIVHWGGSVDESASFGRKSFAIFAQRGDMPALTWDMVKVGESVPFNYRLGLICRQLLRYTDSALNENLAAHRLWHDFATRQEARFSKFLGLMAKMHGREPEIVR